MKRKHELGVGRFKDFRRVLIAACSVAVLIWSAQAQEPAPWIEFTPPGDDFTISISQAPKTEIVTATHGDLQVSGTWYKAGDAEASYSVWSLTNFNPRSGRDSDTELDAAADLFWEALLKPARERVRDHLAQNSSVAYVKESSDSRLPGREYSVKLGGHSGRARVYVSQERIFILLALDSAENLAQRTRFLNSFKLTRQLAVIPSYGDPKSTSDDETIFTTKEVDQRARVLEKTEPSYTESARVFGVHGTVVLRAVFSKTGEVTKIQIVRRLPHGLTERCLASARAIRFSPAQKEGQAVSTYIQLEYNFKLF